MKLLKDWLIHLKLDDHSVILFLIKGYFGLTLICFMLLLLPFFQNESLSIIDHLFFAVSIVSTTGLAPASFADSYNFGGQLFSLIFIQLGGVGYMALSSFILLRNAKQLPQLSARLLRLEFNLPQKYPLVQFIYSVIIFTFLIEFIGIICLYVGFLKAGVEAPLWNAIFHSVSAFCTAGFSLYNDSMISFKEHPFIIHTITILSLLGSIGFIVLLDFWHKIIQKKRAITLTSKIILMATLLLWLGGALLVFFSDPILLQNGWAGLKTALFQSMSAHTTVGFNSYTLNNLSLASTFILIILMAIGASPSGTGGGIKTTSITAALAVLKSILKKGKSITFMNKELPDSNIYLAISTLIFYTIVFFISSWFLLLIDGKSFNLSQILFEAASALSTVGLSTGITDDFSNSSKLIICILMFIGRLGVLTFGFAVIKEAPLIRTKFQIEDIAI